MKKIELIGALLVSLSLAFVAGETFAATSTTEVTITTEEVVELETPETVSIEMERQEGAGPQYYGEVTEAGSMTVVNSSAASKNLVVSATEVIGSGDSNFSLSIEALTNEWGKENLVSGDEAVVGSTLLSSFAVGVTADIDLKWEASSDSFVGETLWTITFTLE